MVQENRQSEAEIRRFLFGEMPEAERSSFESRFVSDESLFDQISVAEDELIEKYVRGKLSPAETTIFEREFLSTESRRRRIAFTRTMVGKIKKDNEVAAIKKTEAIGADHTSVWASISNFFKAPQLAVGFALAVLVLFFGGWILLRNSDQPEIVRQVMPTPEAEFIPPIGNQNSSSNPNTNATDGLPSNKSDLPETIRPATENQNVRAPKQSALNTTPILGLFAGATRSGGKMPVLNLPLNATVVGLQLNLESADYKKYSIEIVESDGKLIFNTSKLKARNSRIKFFVPAGKLPVGDYLVKLSALNPQGENESVADYAFRVSRK